jgi:hypothetical protein
MSNRFPDLSVFLDVSGRISRKSNDPIVLGGIAIKTSEVESVREGLLTVTKGQAKKWSDSADDVESAKLIAKFMAKRQLTGQVWIVRKNSAEWNKYWEIGDEIYEKGVKKAQEAMPYAKPATTLKFHLYVKVSGRLLGFHLRRHANRLPQKAQWLQKLKITTVCDSDVQGETNIRVFRRIFEDVGGLPKTETATNLKPIFELFLKTEQEEPLLILPDHLAGFIYSSDAYGQEVTNNSNNLLQAIKPILSTWPRYALDIGEETFKEEYPINLDVFNHVLPKRARESLIKELKAKGAIPADSVYKKDARDLFEK